MRAWLGRVEPRIDLHFRRAAEHVHRAYLQVLYKSTGHDTNRCFAIDSTVREVVDLVTEWGNFREFMRIDLYAQYILMRPIESFGEFEGKWREASKVFTQQCAIEPDPRCGGCTFEVDEDSLVLMLGRQCEMTAVGGDELIARLVDAVPGYKDVAVRQPY